MRWSWVNFQCGGGGASYNLDGSRARGLLRLQLKTGGGCLDNFTFLYFSLLFLSLWKTIRYRLKYCHKGPLNQKQSTNQPEAEWLDRLDYGEESRRRGVIRTRDSSSDQKKTPSVNPAVNMYLL